MERIKVFEIYSNDVEFCNAEPRKLCGEALEEKVNKWLEKNKEIKIIRMLQSAYCETEYDVIILTIHYVEKESSVSTPRFARSKKA